MNLADLPQLHSGGTPAVERPSRRLRRCESLVVCYLSDRRAIAELLPAPLQPDGSNAASLRFLALPAADGRGVDIAAQIAIDAELDGAPVQFIVRRWADRRAEDHDSDACPRPGRARLYTVGGQVTAVLESAGRALAIASLDKQAHLLGSALRKCPQATIAAWLARPQVYRAASSDSFGSATAGQLLCRRFADIEVRDAFSGAAELDFAPLGANPLPVIAVLGGAHFVADLTQLPEHAVGGRHRRADIASIHKLPQELIA